MSIRKTIKYFDLFAGIGGFNQAIKELKLPNTKFKHIGYCEIDKQARRFYEEVHSQVTNSLCISNALDICTQKNLEGVKIPNFDLLLAGFPCQSFSNVGYRKGLDDKRGKLFYTILDILNSYNPNFFVLENVQKLKTIQGGGLLEEMQDALANIGQGYHLHLWDLRAFNYGVPQNRRRLFFCGVKKSLKDKKSLTIPVPIPLEKTKYPTAWHLLEKQEVDPRHTIPTKTRETVLYKNKKWAGNVDIDNVIARPITASMSKWHRANQDNYFSETYIKNKNPYNRPKIDLKTERIRRITPLEGFRLQGFPDSYAEKAKEIGLAYTTQYRLIGNTVPVPLAKSVIEHFLKNYL